MGHFFISTSRARLYKLDFTLLVLLLAAATAPQPLSAAPQAASQSPGQEQASSNPTPGAQQLDSAETASGQPIRASQENTLGLQMIKNIMRDQGQIWTSPAHVRLRHADWLVPYAGLTAGFLVTDRDANLHLRNSPSTLKHYRDFSNYGLAGMGGAVGGLYLWGKATNDAHKQETGILSGEAVANALFVTEVLKIATGRERPGVDASRGRFWQGGDSFPSGHAAMAWAAASVISHEYPEHSPTAPAISSQVAPAIAAMDSNPSSPLARSLSETRRGFWMPMSA